jgi:tetratricopeptide (TPR) repeat protein
MDPFQAALLCGVLAFLLANTIDFSLFVPGALFPFMGLAGLLFASNGAPAGRRSAGFTGAGLHPAVMRIAPSAGALIGMALFVWCVYRPVTASTEALSLARRAASQVATRPDFQTRALGLYDAAGAADPFDPTPWIEAASLAMRAPDLEAIDQALTHLKRAIALDPRRAATYRTQALLLQLRCQLSGEISDLIAARDAMHNVLELYPNSPDDHVAMADLLAEIAVRTAVSGDRQAFEGESAEYAREAVRRYEEALRLDAARPGVDEVRRWRSQQREAIEQRLRRVRGGLAPTTQTTTALLRTRPCGSWPASPGDS